MEPEQYENLALLAEAIAIDGEENEDIEQDEKDIKDAREVARAMRAPITAKALLADGWTREGCWFDKAMTVVSVLERNKKTFDVIVFVEGNTPSYFAEECRTMYDLRELTRILRVKP